MCSKASGYGGLRKFQRILRSFLEKPEVRKRVVGAEMKDYGEVEKKTRVPRSTTIFSPTAKRMKQDTCKSTRQAACKSTKQVTCKCTRHVKYKPANLYGLAGFWYDGYKAQSTSQWGVIRCFNQEEVWKKAEIWRISISLMVECRLERLIFRKCRCCRFYHLYDP